MPKNETPYGKDDKLTARPQAAKFSPITQTAPHRFIGSAQAARALTACQRADFAGKLWAINPKRHEIAGLPCYPHIEALPEAPDAALLALSPEHTIAGVKALRVFGP